MHRSPFFAVIICAVVFEGSLSLMHGQVPSPAAPAPAAAVVPLKLPLTYVSAQTPADQLQLNSDNSFSLREADQTYHGTFSISGNILELRISETNSNTIATIQGGNLTDSSGQTWVLREQPAHPAHAADVVRNQDVISLVKAGLDDEIVIAKIGSSKCQFDTSPEALAQLRQSGVSAAVINTMVGSRTPPATIGGAPSTLPAAAPAVPSHAGLPDASLNPPAPAQSIQPGPRQDQVNKTAADLTPAEHIYTEIKLGRTKQPERFGDISLMLRETDPENHTYSVDVLADNKLTLMQNKNVNDLVQFYTVKGGPTPYNLLINQVTVDGIGGYLWHQPAVANLGGERNYIDVRLGKTKAPQRFGDVALRLETLDPKRNMYSVEVLADDKLILKKDKSVNQPVQFYTIKGGHNPYELVIIQVTKDSIVGYLSTPKANTATGGNGVTVTHSLTPPSTGPLVDVVPMTSMPPHWDGRGPRSGGPGSRDPDHIAYHNISLSHLVMTAYNLKGYELSAPEWLNEVGFQITATLPPGTTDTQVKVMLQNLLTQRFKLAVHPEPKVIPVYALVVAKDGPKFKESLPETKESGGGTFSQDRRTHRLTRQTTDLLALILSNEVGFPVRNMTGLNGKYDFTLSWVPEPWGPGVKVAHSAEQGLAGISSSEVIQGNDTRPDLFTAVQQQLGLKLEELKGTIQATVVDHIERMPLGNE